MFVAIIESEDGPQAIGSFRELGDARKIGANDIPLRPDIAEIGRRVAEREAETLDALRRL